MSQTSFFVPLFPKKKRKKTKEALYYKSTTFDWLALMIALVSV
jgi:hypothetical protein